jgi:hypothetical protein
MPKNPRSRKREAELNEMAKVCGFATRDKLLSYLLGLYRDYNKLEQPEKMALEIENLTKSMKERGKPNDRLKSNEQPPPKNA